MEYATGLKLMLEDGMNSLWRTVKAMPEDKIDWRPEPTARTTRQLLEELVDTMPFSIEFIKTQKMPKYEESSGKKRSMNEMEKEYRQHMEDFLKAVKNFPEADMQKENDLPWGKMTFFDLITYPYWNLMYHWGQISYIQTMYGDKEMY